MFTSARSFLVPSSVIAFFVLPGCHLSKDTDSFRFEETIERVEVDVDAGLITLRPTASGSSRVDATLEWGAQDAPGIEVFAEDGTLYVRGDCSGKLSCNTDFELQLPAEVEVDIELAAGSVDLRDMSGPLFVDLTTGDLQGWGLESEILHAEVTTGAVDLSFVGGAKTIYTDLVTGDLELEVPNRAYKVQTEVTTGAIDIDVDTSPSADAFIGASVVTGAIHVHPGR